MLYSLYGDKKLFRSFYFGGLYLILWMKYSVGPMYGLGQLIIPPKKTNPKNSKDLHKKLISFQHLVFRDYVGTSTWLEGDKKQGSHARSQRAEQLGSIR